MRSVSRAAVALSVALPIAVAIAPAADAQEIVRLRGAPHALDRFEAALSARRARVWVYGASHTAPDAFTGQLRARLQRRFGDGGPGWVLPAPPFAFYDHARVRIAGDGWSGRAVRFRERARDDYGPAGIAIETRELAHARVDARSAADRFDRVRLHYLRQPNGGELTLRVGSEERRVTTEGARGPGVVELTLSRPAETLTLVARGRVRVFGVQLERGTHGVVLDAFGVPGARFVDQEPWTENGALRAELEARPPDLIAFAYGTNESAQARVPIATYRTQVRRGLARWRRLAPNAECLLIGPGEWPLERGGVWVPRPRTAQIIDVQRGEASRAGCAFFDTYAMMGGEGSMRRWVADGLAALDHVHFTGPGYARMGDALYRALVPDPGPEDGSRPPIE
ncbi:MAG: GDSL-type esterase/lipase family protein [Sandaracinaceae bacterium]